MISSRRSHSRLRSHPPVQTAPSAAHSTPGKTRSRSHSQSETIQLHRPSVTTTNSHHASTSRPHVQSQSHASSKSRIVFGKVHQPHQGFTTFSAHPVTYKRHHYPTVQHLYQASKFLDHRPDIAERVRRCESPSAAVAEAEKHKALIAPSWAHSHINFLDECFYFKFTQHEDLLRELLSTGDAELLENSTSDVYWGAGDAGTGRNELGKSLQRVRKRLRDEALTSSGHARSVPSSSKTRWVGPLPPGILKSSSSSSPSLCHVCQERPQVDAASQVCGYSCGVKSLSHRFPLCDFCHTHERQSGKPYCSQQCAFKLMDLLGSKTDIPCYNCSRTAKAPGIFCRDCRMRAQQSQPQPQLQPSAFVGGAHAADVHRNWSTLVHPSHSNRQSVV